MLLNNKGFTLFEVLISFSLFMTIIMTVVPLIILVETERKVLSERRMYASLLHDELQYMLSSSRQASSIVHDDVTMTFTRENDFLKGCVTWENKKQQNDEICLYGLP